MQSSQIPVRIPTPFADQAVDPTYRHQVPENSQIGITDGAASFETGFVPLNFVPTASGGVPPFGNDFNGLLYQITQWLRWAQAGAIVPFDETFATDIGGYPLGAIVASATTAKKFWVSTVENNTQNPDTATPDLNGNPTQWQYFLVGATGPSLGSYVRPAMTVNAAGQITAIANGAYPTRTTLTSGSGTYNVPAGVKRIAIRMVGGGGGGGGTGTGATAGGTGGDTTFNSIVAKGGGGGSAATASTGANGGTPGGTGSGTANLRFTGGYGAQGADAIGGSAAGVGGNGASSPFGGAGASRRAAAATAASTNSGSGGGGSMATASTFGGGGGGAAGEYVEIQIAPTAASYSYSVGSAGAPGSAGTSGTNGGAGAAGIIIIDEFYD